MKENGLASQRARPPDPDGCDASQPPPQALFSPPSRMQAREGLNWRIPVAAVAAALIFAVDVFTSLEGDVSVLYTVVVLLVATTAGRRTVLAAGGLCCCLVVIAFAFSHFGEAWNGAYVRFGVSLTALAITTLLAVKNRSAETTLAEQARILELTHDTVIIRDAENRIIYWNDGAERLYGWRREEAMGQICQELLETQYPAEQVAERFAAAGRWSGELTRVRRDGARIPLASRWLARFDAEGRKAGVIETSADLTAERTAESERRESEERYRTMFRAAGFAIWEADWSDRLHIIGDLKKNGVVNLAAYLDENRDFLRECMASAHVTDANDAAVRLFEAGGREDLIGLSLSRFFTAAEEGAVAQALSLLFEGEAFEGETQYCTLKGRRIDVLRRACIVGHGDGRRRILVTAIDVTERNRTQARLNQTLAELAHASRVALLGQFAASIAHEVNQPLAAITTYAQSGKRWLDREAPEADEVRDCLEHIVENGRRATEVIAGLRALTRKAMPRTEPLRLHEVIDESLALVRGELLAGSVNIQRNIAEDLPWVSGDRVQIQQVVINLLMNGIQAMAAVDPARRDLCVETCADGQSFVRMSVRDFGAGIADPDPEQVFQPFFTTKSNGAGMGLSICRSIVEAHGGRIWAENNDVQGATFLFTLPIAESLATCEN